LSKISGDGNACHICVVLAEGFSDELVHTPIKVNCLLTLSHFLLWLSDAWENAHDISHVCSSFWCILLSDNNLWKNWSSMKIPIVSDL
jgi:hypothetical protein